MIRPSSRLLIVVALTCAAYATLAGGDALARTQLNSPFGASAPVTVYAGSCGSAPCQLAVWQRKSDGACSTMTIGDGAGLFDDTELYGSSGADDMTVGIIHGLITFCGVNLVNLLYNGHYLDLYGRQGNDFVEANMTGDTWLFGEEGNDSIFGVGPGIQFGGDGNDGMQVSGPFPSNSQYGENGSDYLEQFNPIGYADCGAGTDILHHGSTGAYPMNISCETFN